METSTMDAPVNEHDLIVANIANANKDTYKILSNTGKDDYYVGSMFPDLILVDKTTDKPVFIIEVKKNGNIAQCIQQWKAVSSIPATLYIVVPLTDLPNAKAIAQVVGLNTRFGSYTIDDKNKIIVKYE